MIRVLNIISDSNIGGAGRVLLSYLKNADRESFEILTAVPRGSLLKAPLEALGGKVYEVDGLAERSYHRDDVKTLRALIREVKPDIVHTHGALSGRIAARQEGVGAVVMTKHCPAARGSVAGRLGHAALDPMLSDAMIAVSETVGRQLTAAGTPRRLVTVVRNGITPVEPPTEQEETALRERFGMDKEHLWIGVAARLEPVKGVDLFLKAAELLAGREDLRFMIWGTGSMEETLRAQAAPLGDKVRFGGFVSEIEQALSLLDVAVVSSRSEAICLSAIEALSMGTPVVGFDVDGVSEVVREGETGFLAPPEDVSALAERILRLADDRRLRRQMGEAGEKMVRETMTARQMAREIEAVYRKTLKGAEHGT